jgi:hypothetical protein
MLLDDRIALGPDPGVAEEVLHVAQPAGGAVDQVLRLAGAVEAARDPDLVVAGELGGTGAVAVLEAEDDLGHSGGPAPSPFSKLRMTSASPTPERPSEPPKITSSMDLPRRRRGACSPMAHRMASTTFDLPQPFGPTTAVIPSSKRRTVLVQFQ